MRPKRNCEIEKCLIKLTNGLLFVFVVKPIKVAAYGNGGWLTQRLPPAGIDFHAVFKKTKISRDFFGSFFYQ